VTDIYRRPLKMKPMADPQLVYYLVSHGYPSSRYESDLNYAWQEWRILLDRCTYVRTVSSAWR